jgi:P22_AR N-terminal domain/ORF6C domain
MTREKNTLVPTEQKTVLFYDDELIAIRGSDSHVYVSIGQLCDALGLDRASQVRRIRNSEILADGYQGSVNLTYPDGGTQRSGVLRVDLVPLWLTGIRIKAVKDEIKPKLKRFQREAAKVLWEAFQEGRLTTEPIFDELLQYDTPEVQAYKMIQGMLQLAKTQILIRAQIEDHEQRLELIESQLGDPEQYVTPEQAMQISQAVKAVAHELGKRSKRNEYGGVYGEMYRRYGINSYKALPKRKFEDALGWLNDWLQALISNVPF